MILLSPFRENRPLMISGGGRSGTTAMIRALAGSGMKTFYDPDSRNAEEEAVLDLFRSGDADATLQFVDARVASLGPHWATKMPSLVNRAGNHTALAEAWLCNWLVMVRDPIATAVRDASSRAGLCVVQGAFHRVAETISILSACQVLSRQYGVLIVSYEKLMLRPMETLREVWGWIGRECGEEAIAQGVKELRAGDPRYFDG